MAAGAATHAPRARGLRARRWWFSLGIVLVAVVAVNVAAWMTQRAVETAARVPGLSVLRPPGEVSAMLLDAPTMYAGGTDGLTAIDVETLTVSRPAFAAGLDLGHVRALLLDDDGTLWVGHERGLVRVRDAEVREYGAQDGLPSERVQSLLRTEQGDLVVGTSLGAAVMRHGAEEFEPFGADGLIVFALHETHGLVLLGTSSAPRGGLAIVGDGGTRWMTSDDGLPHANVTSFEDAADGTVWVGTGFHERGGAVRVRFDETGEPVVVETLTLADGLAGAKVRSIFRDADGAVWFGSEYDGVAIAPPGSAEGARKLVVVRAAAGLSHPEVKCFVRDDLGRVWMGTLDGITIVEDPAALWR